MDLNNLLSGQTADVKVEWEGEVANVTFLKHAYTPKLEAEVMAESGSGGANSVADLLGQLLHDWDITQNGEPFPPTRDHLAILPVSFLVACMKAISEVMAQDPLLSVNSEGHS